jgi:hypothetical protein
MKKNEEFLGAFRSAIDTLADLNAPKNSSFFFIELSFTEYPTAHIHSKVLLQIHNPFHKLQKSI